MIFYNNSSSLTHHGIKGQKWGVRRFQNKDGSLTPRGEKHRAKLNKALNDAIFNRQSFEDAASKKSNAAYEKIRKRYGAPGDRATNKEQLKFWYGTDDNSKIKDKSWRGYTNKAKRYVRELERVSDKMRDKEIKARNKDWDREEKNWKTVEKDRNIKESMSSAKKLMKQIADLYDNSIGEDSEAYNKAFNTFKQKNKKKYEDDPDEMFYAFDHYEWGKGNKAYDKAYADYNKKSKELNKQLESQIDKVINLGFGEKTVSNLSKEQMETAKSFVDMRIRYDFKD